MNSRVIPPPTAPAGESSARLFLNYRYRLLPTRKQHAALALILEDQRQLYNAALQERVDAYRKAGLTRTYVDQCRELTACRREMPEMAYTPVNLQRGTLSRLDRAFRGFFRRLKVGAKAGYPRFRGKGWMDSFEFREFCGINFDGQRLRFRGVPGGLRVHMHRPLPAGKILSAKFKRDPKGWSVCLVVETPSAPKRPVTSRIGVDVGILTLAATSDGDMIPNPRPARRAEREMRRRARRLARCKRGSRRRRKVQRGVARLHRAISNARQTTLHQVSSRLVQRYDLIAIEALNANGLARSKLARDVNDAGFATLRDFLRYKAERAGAHLVEVDPKFTSQDCPQCGRREAKTLDQRVHSCPCGCVLDRDVAAARVILSRAVAGPGVHNVAGYGERALGNLTETSS